MTREEQIERASHEYSIVTSHDHMTRDFTLDWEDVETAFQSGAEWADSNPCWHKCEDEMPEPDTKVLALARRYNVYYPYVGYYNEEDECWRAEIDNQEIEIPTDYWAELPQPPKFD